MRYTDKEILKAIRSGDDREVLKYMYDKLFPKVKQHVMRNSGDSDAAFDVFQDSMMVFYKYVRMNRFDTKYEIGAFVFSVSKKMWINKLNKDKRNISLPDQADFKDDTGNIMDLMITRERENFITAALKELGKRCQKLLQLSVFYKLRNSEICQRMGFATENAVKTRKYKCMQQLISIIENKPALKRASQEL